MKKTEMNAFYRMAWGLFLSCVIVTAYSASLQQSITRWQSTIPNGPHWGAVVYDVTAKKRVLAYQAHTDFVPASTMKLFTATAAIAILGPRFSFQTRIGYRGKIKNGVLEGDVWLSMGGDPTLNMRDVRRLVALLKNKGIRRVTGKFRVATPMAQAVPYGPGWMWDELSYQYAVPLAPVIINRNRFMLSMTPKKGRVYAHIYAHVPSGVLRVVNRLKLTQRHSKWCPISIYSTQGNRYFLRGCLVRSWGKQNRVLSIRDSWAYLRVLLKQSLGKAMITVKSLTLQTHVPKSIHWISTHRSAPLSSLLKTMLKQSDNLIADSLFLAIGRQKKYAGDAWQQASQVVRAFLKKSVGIDTNNLNLADGSGLSRYNLIRPIQLFQLLRFIDQHKRYHQVIYNSLPILGQDGTLSFRFKGRKGMTGVRAKTGSMSGVSALAGYIHADNRHHYIFVSMMNGYVHKIRSWRPIEDRLLWIIVKK